jgi:hypothetical protein
MRKELSEKLINQYKTSSLISKNFDLNHTKKVLCQQKHRQQTDESEAILEELYAQ